MITSLIRAFLHGTKAGKGYRAYKEGNFAEALRCLEPLAKLGEEIPQYYVGRMYFYGEGVAEDKSESASWFRASAKQGLDLSQYLLGILLQEDESSPDSVPRHGPYHRLCGKSCRSARTPLRLAGHHRRLSAPSSTRRQHS